MLDAVRAGLGLDCRAPLVVGALDRRSRSFGGSSRSSWASAPERSSPRSPSTSPRRRSRAWHVATRWASRRARGVLRWRHAPPGSQERQSRRRGRDPKTAGLAIVLGALSTAAGVVRARLDAPRRRDLGLAPRGDPSLERPRRRRRRSRSPGRGRSPRLDHSTLARGRRRFRALPRDSATGSGWSRPRDRWRSPRPSPPAPSSPCWPTP